MHRDIRSTILPALAGAWKRAFTSVIALVLLATAAPARASAPDPPTWMLKWGSLGSNPGQFNYPVAVATDELGNVYVVDQNNHRVQKFDRGGAYLTRWGASGSATASSTTRAGSPRSTTCRRPRRRRSPPPTRRAPRICTGA